jgi:protein TonB
MTQLMTADQATVEVKNAEVVEVVEAVKEEVQEEDPEATPFVVVEEMPSFPGGDGELLKYLAANTNYPEVAKENNIQGRVIVRFCVTSKGGVNQVSILKGVDPELDAEAIRVVNTLPTFKPGKQGGKPVPVWYMVPIIFTLK